MSRKKTALAAVGFFLALQGLFGLPAAARPPLEGTAPLSAGQGESISIREKHNRGFSHLIKGADLKFPAEIRLRNNEADLSAFVRELKRAALESNYDNSYKLEIIRHDLDFLYIEELCRKSPAPDVCRDKAGADLDEALEEIHQKMEGRILYPPEYRPISEKGLSGEALQDTLEALDSECPQGCHEGSLADAARYGSQEQYQKLLDKLKSKDRLCRKAAVEAAAKELQSEEFPKLCLKQENKSHEVCKNMLKNLKAIQDRVSDLIALAGGPEGEALTEAGAPCLECALESEGEGGVYPFDNLLQSLRDGESCLELNPGEEKLVRSGRGMFSFYILKRDPEGGYAIDFPLEISIDEGYDGPFSKEEAPARYRERIQKCLAEASQMMLGPGGEKLKISISRPAAGPGQDNPGSCLKRGAWLANVSIGSKDHRSNSEKYESDIDCETVTHEVLHLTGLCDEYKEKLYGFYVDPETGEAAGSNFGRDKKDINSAAYDFEPAYGCRALSSNSIMSDQHKRWRNVKGGRNKSLLTPGQFQGILYGSCPAKNGRFNECSRLAYQSPRESGREGCQEARRQCERENALGLDKQEETEALREDIKALEGYKEGILEMRKQLRKSGMLDRTKRSFYEEQIKMMDQRESGLKKQLAGKSLPESEKKALEADLNYLREFREMMALLQKTDEEKGLLDQTEGEANQELLSQTEDELRAAKERLKIVQSWP